MMQKDRGLVVGSATGAFVAAVAAVGGVLCCLGPAVVAVLGVGGAVAAARLAPYRPYFLLTAIGLLALGIGRALVLRRRATSCDTCVRPGRWTWVLLGGAALVTLASLLLPMVLE